MPRYISSQKIKNYSRPDWFIKDFKLKIKYLENHEGDNKTILKKATSISNSLSRKICALEKTRKNNGKNVGELIIELSYLGITLFDTALNIFDNDRKEEIADEFSVYHSFWRLAADNFELKHALHKA